MQDAWLAAAGLSPKDVTVVPAPNFVVGVKAFMEGRTDAAYIPFNSGIGKQAMAKIPGGWRYLSTGTAPDADAKAGEALPTARTVKIKPGKNATGVAENPTTLIAIDVAMFTNASVPDDVVYKVVKTIYESKPELIKALGAFARFNPKRWCARARCRTIPARSRPTRNWAFGRNSLIRIAPAPPAATEPAALRCSQERSV